MCVCELTSTFPRMIQRSRSFYSTQIYSNRCILSMKLVSLLLERVKKIINYVMCKIERIGVEITWRELSALNDWWWWQTQNNKDCEISIELLQIPVATTAFRNIGVKNEIGFYMDLTPPSIYRKKRFHLFAQSPSATTDPFSYSRTHIRICIYVLPFT